MPLLSAPNQQVLLEALGHVSSRLLNRLASLTRSNSTLDVCECLTAAVYLMSSACRLDFVSHLARRESFVRANWNCLSRQQTVDDMVEGGFYALQDGDHVKCFFCDLELRDWDARDSPEMEHAKISPLCFFLKSSRGLDWLKLSNPHFTNYPMSYQRQDCNNLLNVLWQEFSRTRVRAVRGLGFNETKVLLFIARRFLKQKSKYRTMEELVFELQAEWGRELAAPVDAWFSDGIDVASVLLNFFCCPQ